MKKYIKPVIKVKRIRTKIEMLLQSSGGLTTGDAVGNEYNGSDVTYSREGGSIWDDEE